MFKSNTQSIFIVKMRYTPVKVGVNPPPPPGQVFSRHFYYYIFYKEKTYLRGFANNKAQTSLRKRAV